MGGLFLAESELLFLEMTTKCSILNHEFQSRITIRTNTMPSSNSRTEEFKKEFLTLLLKYEVFKVELIENDYFSPDLTFWFRENKELGMPREELEFYGSSFSPNDFK